MPTKTQTNEKTRAIDPRDDLLEQADDVIRSLSRMVDESVRMATTAYWQKRNAMKRKTTASA